MAKNPVNASEKPATTKTSLKERTRNICKRFWWLFLILFLIVTLVIVLPIVLVGYPKTARHAVRDSSLNITYMAILDPAPDSVELTVVEKLYSKSSYHPTLSSFNASLYLLGADNPPFARIETPQIKAHNNATINIGPQRISINYLEEFTNFVLMTAASDVFTFALRGDGDLKEGGLPTIGVRYDKNITMKGLNKLSSFELLSFNVLNTTEPDGTNAIASVSIPNPTVMSIALGNVTLSMSVNGTSIGNATILDLFLQPGENVKTMRAEVYQLVVAAIVMQRENTTIPVDIRGNTSTFDGQEIPYYNTMLQATQLRVDLDVSKALGG